MAWEANAGAGLCIFAEQFSGPETTKKEANMAEYLSTANLSSEICYKCAMVFAMPSDFQRRRRDDKLDFFCPAGHAQRYIGPTNETRLRQELEREKERREAETQRAARLSTERDQIARAHNKMRVRVMNGVCPCCNRTFQNLLRHMQTEHQGELTLKRLREAYGMTQAQLAREIGVPQNYISMEERERPLPARGRQIIETWIAAQEGRVPA